MAMTYVTRHAVNVEGASMNDVKGSSDWVFELVFDLLVRTWRAKGCHEELAKENAAIELCWIWQACSVTKRASICGETG
jgi:hypothetical protein